jgi:hypothetical protein
MNKVLKQITVYFKYDAYSKNTMDENNDKLKVMTDFFDNLPYKPYKMGGPQVWVTNGHPQCFYYNISMSHLQEIIQYIESCETYRVYSRIVISC